MNSTVSPQSPNEMMEDNRLKDFLHEFYLNEEVMQEVYERFCKEIRKGLKKETRPKADTKCYVTYVQDFPTGDELGNYLALDLGGSNFRVLLVSLKGQHDAVIDFKTYAMEKEIVTGPGRKLFDYIAACLSDFVKEHKVATENLHMGFTFSFPCVQIGLSKALLVRWTKGFSSPGVVNEDVGRMLRDAIARRGDAFIDVIAILNDTTGTLMSCAHRNPDCKIGLILGTGCNACYVEKVENVEMLEEQYKKNKTHVIINVEWGAFGDHGTLDFLLTDFDREIDRKSLNKGTQIFEKMMGGMYLGELVRLVLIRAIEENLIFSACAHRSKVLPILVKNKGCIETRHLSEVESDRPPNDFQNTRRVLKELCQFPDPCPEDCQRMWYICECISKRAAKFAGIGLSGLINKMGEPKVVVGVDGTLYRLHPKFDMQMRKTMMKFVNPEIKFDLMLSEDGSGRGAALVAAVVATQCKS